MASLKTTVKSLAGALTLAIAGGGVAQAQSYGYNERQIHDAELRAIQMQYRGELAGCTNFNTYRSCRELAGWQMLDRQYSLARQYNYATMDMLERTYAQRLRANEAYRADQLRECNTSYPGGVIGLLGGGRGGSVIDNQINNANCRRNVEVNHGHNMRGSADWYAGEVRNLAYEARNRRR